MTVILAPAGTEGPYIDEPRFEDPMEDLHFEYGKILRQVLTDSIAGTVRVAYL